MTDYVFPRGKLERDSSFGAVAPTDESINDLMKKVSGVEPNAINVILFVINKSQLYDFSVRV